MREHVPYLNQSQIDAYKDVGYVLVKGCMDPALLEEMTQTTRRLAEESRTLTKSDAHYDIDTTRPPDQQRLRRISSPTEVDDVYHRVCFDSVVGDIVADLVGRAVKFYHSKVNFKLGDQGAEIAWHQDWVVFPHTNTDAIAVSVPMTKRTADNGGLRLIPGIHKKGPRSHWENGKFLIDCKAELTEGELASAVCVEMEPGDIVAHHGLLVHGSGPNDTGETHLTLTIQYFAADAMAYTAPVIDSRHRNDMVRGEMPRFARVEAGLIELPPDYGAAYTSIHAIQEADEESVLA